MMGGVFGSADAKAVESNFPERLLMAFKEPWRAAVGESTLYSQIKCIGGKDLTLAAGTSCSARSGFQVALGVLRAISSPNCRPLPTSRSKISPWQDPVTQRAVG
jgi:hypothetical protein